VLGTAALTGRLSAQTFAQFPVPSAVCPDHGMTGGCQPYGIVGGPDGSVWFTEMVANKIGRITPLGSITEFPVPTTDSGPYGIAAGADGNLWFTESRAGKIGRITPGGTITEFSLSPGRVPWAMTAGPDGNVWYTDAARIGRVTPGGVVTEFPLATGGASDPFAIVTGPDGNLWFTEMNANKVGRITPAGVVSDFPIPTLYSGPRGITAGPDGALWFTENGLMAKIGRIAPTGVITEFPLPDSYGPLGIAAGPDGNLWFTENDVDSIGRLSPSGSFDRLAYVPSGAYSEPYAITLGPDGNLWFTEAGLNTIGRIRLRPQSFSTMTPCRAIDTREPDGPLAGPALVGGTTRTFTLAGRCDIPAGAAAISANVTVTGATTAGDLRLYAPGNNPFTSTLNFAVGQTRANSAVVPLGPSGELNVLCGCAPGTVDFILDVGGVFQ
jgi:streptogramin lyase